MDNLWEFLCLVLGSVLLQGQGTNSIIMEVHSVIYYAMYIQSYIHMISFSLEEHWVMYWEIEICNIFASDIGLWNKSKIVNSISFLSDRIFRSDQRHNTYNSLNNSGETTKIGKAASEVISESLSYSSEIEKINRSKHPYLLISNTGICKNCKYYFWYYRVLLKKNSNYLAESKARLVNRKFAISNGRSIRWSEPR